MIALGESLRRDTANFVPLLMRTAQAGVSEVEEYESLIRQVDEIDTTIDLLKLQLGSALLRTLFRRVPLQELLKLDPESILWIRRDDDRGLSRYSRVVLKNAIDMRANETPHIKLYLEGKMAQAEIKIPVSEAETHQMHQCLDIVKLRDLLAEFLALVPLE